MLKNCSMNYMSYSNSNPHTVRFLKSWTVQNFTRFSLSFSSCIIYVYQKRKPQGDVSILTVSSQPQTNCQSVYAKPYAIYTPQNTDTNLTKET